MIAFNSDSAVAVDVDPAVDVAGNSILSNAIFGNGGVAIDLASDGPTANDPGDADGGPNRLQNFPVLQALIANGGGRIVRGTLGNTPLTAFVVEFFASSRAGEGEVFLGSMIVLTRADGTTPTFSFRYASVPGKPFVTATNLGTVDTSHGPDVPARTRVARVPSTAPSIVGRDACPERVAKPDVPADTLPDPESVTRNRYWAFRCAVH